MYTILITITITSVIENVGLLKSGVAKWFFTSTLYEPLFPPSRSFPCKNIDITCTPRTELGPDFKTFNAVYRRDIKKLIKPR